MEPVRSYFLYEGPDVFCTFINQKMSVKTCFDYVHFMYVLTFSAHKDLCAESDNGGKF